MKMPDSNDVATENNSSEYQKFAFGHISLELGVKKNAKMMKFKDDDGEFLLVESVFQPNGKYPTSLYVAVEVNCNSFKQLMLIYSKETPFNSFVLSGNIGQIKLSKGYVPNSSFEKEDIKLSLKKLIKNNKITESHIIKVISGNCIHPHLSFNRSNFALEKVAQKILKTDEVYLSYLNNLLLSVQTENNNTDGFLNNIQVGFDGKKEIFFAKVGEEYFPFTLFDSEEQKRSLSFHKDNKEQLVEGSLFPMPLQDGGIQFYVNVVNWEERNRDNIVDTDVDDIINIINSDSDDDDDDSDNNHQPDINNVDEIFGNDLDF